MQTHIHTVWGVGSGWYNKNKLCAICISVDSPTLFNFYLSSNLTLRRFNATLKLVGQQKKGQSLQKFLSSSSISSFLVVFLSVKQWAVFEWMKSNSSFSPRDDPCILLAEMNFKDEVSLCPLDSPLFFFHSTKWQLFPSNRLIIFNPHPRWHRPWVSETEKGRERKVLNFI